MKMKLKNLEDFSHWHRAHESRRIDNQLRGRAGRQGDRVVLSFISLQDELMRIFGGVN